MTPGPRVGTDVVDVRRFARALARTPSLRQRLFTDREVEAGDLAGVFAVKEAVAKALGAPPGLVWRDVEVSVRGPALSWRGTVAARARELGLDTAHVEVQPTPTHALAVVVLAPRAPG